MLSFGAICEYAIGEYEILVVIPPVEPPPPGPGDDPVPPPPPSPDDPPSPPRPVTPLPTVLERYSSHSFVTRVADNPSQTFIPGRLTRSLTVGRRIKPGPDGQFGGLIVASFGEIELSNTDGALDFLADDFFVDGRAIRIKLGRTELDAHGREVVWPFGAFQTVYTAVAGAWTIEHDSLRLRIRDQGISLQRQLQQATYGGSGGQQGTPDMQGRTVPTCLGRCMNVSAQQVDPVFLTYQVHDSAVQSIFGVYDAGVSVPFAADYPSYPALVAATIPAGQHATSLTAGVFRLGTSPVGTVTADVEGDNTGADWAATHATIIRRILTKYSAIQASQLDEISFLAFHNLQNDVIGIYLPSGDQSSMEQVIERIALSAGAVAGQDRSGLYRIVRLDAPSPVAVREFTDINIMAIERMALPYGVPFRNWTVEGARNWTVQSGGDLAGIVTQTRRRFLEAAARTSAVDVPGVAQANVTSANAVRQSLFHFISNATDEAVRLATFYSLGRALYRLTVRGALFELSIGDTVKLTYPRWNLAQGRHFIVVAVSDNISDTEIEVYG